MTTVNIPMTAISPVDAGPTPESNSSSATNNFSGTLRNRRIGGLQIFNGLTEVPDTSLLQTSSVVSPALPGVLPQRLVVEITVNRFVRFLSILGLGFGGGWSLIPDERRTPTTVAWVACITFITDWLFREQLSPYFMY
jgi:hypothetical protein